MGSVIILLFDTRLVDLRGRGENWPESRPNRQLQWCFDDFAERDLPTAVARVCELSDAGEAFWLGMEMNWQPLVHTGGTGVRALPAAADTPPLFRAGSATVRAPVAATIEAVFSSGLRAIEEVCQYLEKTI